MTFAVRSSVNQEKVDLAKRLDELAAFHGATCTHRGDYPAWEYKKDSDLRDTMVQVYEEMYGEKPAVQAIHAGLECGLLSEKIPGLDCISFGPTAYDIHTPAERLSITSAIKVFGLICNTLSKL